jgi:hypothetical protein
MMQSGHRCSAHVAGTRRALFSLLLVLFVLFADT